MVKNITSTSHGQSHTHRMGGIGKSAFFSIFNQSMVSDSCYQARTLRRCVLQSLQRFEGSGFFKTKNDLENSLKVIGQHPLHSLEALRKFESLLQPMLGMHEYIDIESKIKCLREHLQQQSVLQQFKNEIIQEAYGALKASACNDHDAKWLRAMLYELDPSGFTEEEMHHIQRLMQRLQNPSVLTKTQVNLAAANALHEDSALSLEALRI